MSKWYREPLLHFTLIAIFFLLLIENKHAGNNVIEKENKKIIISAQKVEELRVHWKQLQGREATSLELNSSIEKYIENEIFYQEALRLQLDKDEPVIKKVLIDKLHYISSELVDMDSGSEEVLKKYFNQHKERFIKDEKSISFEHIYLNPQKHKELKSFARTLRTQIHTHPYNKTASALGDKFHGPNVFTEANNSILGHFFSHAFIEQLFSLEEKKWSKPLTSGFGIHLIYVENIRKSKIINYNDLKEDVKRDWLIEEKKKSSEQFYKKLRKEYTVERL